LTLDPVDAVRAMVDEQMLRGGSGGLHRLDIFATQIGAPDLQRVPFRPI
jgi:hypothetical protein